MSDLEARVAALESYVGLSVEPHPDVSVGVASPVPTVQEAAYAADQAAIAKELAHDKRSAKKTTR